MISLEAIKEFQIDSWEESYKQIYQMLQGDTIKNKFHYERGFDRIQKGINQWKIKSDSKSKIKR